jgi:hypothetical protein
MVFQLLYAIFSMTISPTDLRSNKFISKLFHFRKMNENSFFGVKMFFLYVIFFASLINFFFFLYQRLFSFQTPISVQDLCKSNFILGHAFARAALEVIQEAHLRPEDIDIIGMTNLQTLHIISYHIISYHIISYQIHTEEEKDQL